MIETISVDEFERSARSLWTLHHAETEPTMPVPNPSFDFYRGLESRNEFMLYVDRCGSELIGYVAGFVYVQPHYGIVCAQHDVLFVLQEHRMGRTAFRLRDSLRADAKRRGAVFLFWHAKPNSAMERLLKKRSVLEEVIYREEL